MLIQALKKQKPNIKVIISVPSTNLKDQWMEYVIKGGLLNNVTVGVINSLITRDSMICDLLVIDEIHTSLSNQFINIFNKIKFTYFLGLTATPERLDGRHELILSKFPIVDSITIQEALQNNWLSKFRKYLVVLDVELNPYIEANREFYEGFEYFNNDFTTAMKCRTDYKFRLNLAKKMVRRGDDISNKVKEIIIYASKFGRGLQKRKDFIAYHPKKIELANKILAARTDKKSIVFCHTIKMADKINALVYSGKDTGKKGRAKLEDFIQAETGAIATSKKLVAGFDCPDLSVMVDLDTNSSKIRANQSIKK